LITKPKASDHAVNERLHMLCRPPTLRRHLSAMLDELRRCQIGNSILSSVEFVDEIVDSFVSHRPMKLGWYACHLFENTFMFVRFFQTFDIIEPEMNQQLICMATVIVLIPNGNCVSANSPMAVLTLNDKAFRSEFLEKSFRPNRASSPHFFAAILAATSACLDGIGSKQAARRASFMSKHNDMSSPGPLHGPISFPFFAHALAL
jgi:hypothetical protein